MSSFGCLIITTKHLYRVGFKCPLLCIAFSISIYQPGKRLFRWINLSVIGVILVFSTFYRYFRRCEDFLTAKIDPICIKPLSCYI